jgi:hypothetical protein
VAGDYQQLTAGLRFGEMKAIGGLICLSLATMRKQILSSFLKRAIIAAFSGNPNGSRVRLSK